MKRKEYASDNKVSSPNHNWGR